MCATIEKFLIRASVITSQSSTPAPTDPASDTQPRMVGDDRSRLENHVGADLGVGADAGVRGDDAIGEACPPADAGPFPENRGPRPGPRPDPARGAAPRRRRPP